MHRVANVGGVIHGRERDKKMKLAIVIPAYNCEATIKETLMSLQSITTGWPCIDCVMVCDDASTDETVAAIHGVQFDRSALTVLRHPENRGEAACYKTMLDALPSQIDWFLILHSDDIALGCFIERNVAIAEKCAQSKVAAVSSNYFVFGSGPERLAHSPADDVIVFRGGAASELRHTAREGCWWHISGSLINRHLWEMFGGRSPALPQVGDWDLMLRWQSAGYSVGHSLIPTTKYRAHRPGSISSKSYAEFRDLRERTEVIVSRPDVFDARLRRHLARQIGMSAARRVLKLLGAGKLKLALRGLSHGVKCIRALLGTNGLAGAGEGVH